jgi:hypothetical protein
MAVVNVACPSTPLTDSLPDSTHVRHFPNAVRRFAGSPTRRSADSRLLPCAPPLRHHFHGLQSEDGCLVRGPLGNDHEHAIHANGYPDRHDGIDHRLVPPRGSGR